MSALLERFREQDLWSVVGRPFPGGTYTAEPWRSWLTNDTVLGPQSDPALHPVFAFLATTGAMGLTWGELFAWFGASAADGPMIGDCEIELLQPMVAGSTYRIGGEICSAERKVGRRAGTFDLVNYRLDMRDDMDRLVATCRNSLVLPRRS